MSEQKDGGPAFPTLQTLNKWRQLNKPSVPHLYAVNADGMSLRDYFAAAIITGLMASDEFNRTMSASAGNATTAARAAFSIADAMIAERATQSTVGGE